MGRFANPACYGARQQQRKQQQPSHGCRLLGRGSTGPIRRLFGGRYTSSRGSQHQTEAPQITTTVNTDGSVTGMVTLPTGVQPHDINFRTTTTHNGKAMNYTVNLPRGKASSEFFDTRNKTNFCKMSSTRNSDGRYTVSFTLYSQATNATLFIPHHASQSFSRLEAIANQSGKETERITGEALENTPIQSIETSKNKDGSITGVVHLTPEQARAKIDFSVSKISGSSRSKIQSSLDKCTLSARVDGFYDVRRTVKPDGSAILSMTLPPGDLSAKIVIGGRELTLSPDSISVEDEMTMAEKPSSNPITEQSSSTSSIITSDSPTELEQNSNLAFLRSYAESLPIITKSTLTSVPDEVQSSIDHTRSPLGLVKPAGLDNSTTRTREYLFLRSNSYDDSASILRIIQRDPPVFSRDESSYLQSIAVQAYALNTQHDSSMAFNAPKVLFDAVKVGDKTYNHAEVRGDGSVVLASSIDASADLAVLRPGVNSDGSISWSTKTVYRYQDGSIQSNPENPTNQPPLQVTAADAPNPKSEEPASPSDSIADSGSVRVEKATQGEVHLSKASNVDFVYAWTPPKDHYGSGIYPIADASKVDVSSGSTGLHSPAGVGLNGHYRILRTVNTVGSAPMPVMLMHTPSTESKSMVEQLVSRAMPAHVVHYDNAIRFNTAARVSGELPSNLRYYQHSQVRSDGSMLFSRTPDITAPGADLHIAAPRFRDNALEQWDWISVELKADGSVTRKKYGN